MIDYRIKTFLTLCDTMNYTKTAEILCITQPAVTQHIKYLEEMYSGKLFSYKGKILSKTKKGIALERYARSMIHNSDNIKKELAFLDKERVLKIGTTKTISEFVLKDKIYNYLKKDDKRNISLVTGNTKELLKLLEQGKIDFAIIEGIFDKGKYGYKLFNKERFVGICSNDHPFAKKEIDINKIFSENLIVREKGSGTRNIFELFLQEKNYSLNNFKKVTEISEFNIIKKLVSKNLGISFVYSPVVENESSLSFFTLKNEEIVHEFNYVYLKDNLFLEYIQEFEND